MKLENAIEVIEARSENAAKARQLIYEIMEELESRLDEKDQFYIESKSIQMIGGDRGFTYRLSIKNGEVNIVAEKGYGESYVVREDYISYININSLVSSLEDLIEKIEKMDNFSEATQKLASIYKEIKSGIRTVFRARRRRCIK